MLREAKLINISSKYEAEKKYKEFVEDVYHNNAQCNAAIIITIILAIFAIAAANFYLQSTLREAVSFGAIVIAGIICYAASEGYESSCSMLAPAEYRYYQILTDARLLKTEIKSCDNGAYNVVLTVANNKNEVSYEWLYGFKKVTKTDVKELVVDLANQVIYEPYNE